MNPIKISKKYVYENINMMYDEFKYKSNNTDYKIIPHSIDEILNNIKNVDIKRNILYFLIKFCEIDDIENPLSISDGGKPTNGFEFINKKTFEGLGIYHCHISEIDKGVLIWYIITDENYQPLLKFEYMTHPKDDYKKILNEIYNDPNTLNMNTGKYFSDSLNLLMENNIIVKFFNFILNKNGFNKRRY